jgi:hypothetical protein
LSFSMNKQSNGHRICADAWRCSNAKPQKLIDVENNKIWKFRCINWIPEILKVSAKIHKLFNRKIKPSRNKKLQFGHKKWQE